MSQKIPLLMPANRARKRGAPSLPRASISRTRVRRFDSCLPIVPIHGFRFGPYAVERVVCGCARRSESRRGSRCSSAATLARERLSHTEALRAHTWQSLKSMICVDLMRSRKFIAMMPVRSARKTCCLASKAKVLRRPSLGEVPSRGSAVMPNVSRDGTGARR